MQIAKFTRFDLSLNINESAENYEKLKTNYPEIDAALMAYITGLRSYKGSILSVANAAYEVDAWFQTAKSDINNQDQTEAEDDAEMDEILSSLRKRYYDLLKSMNKTIKDELTAISTTSLDGKNNGFLELINKMYSFGTEALLPFKSDDLKDLNPDFPNKIEESYLTVKSAFGKLVSSIDKIITAEEIDYQAGSESIFEKEINDFINSWCLKQVETNKKSAEVEEDQGSEQIQERRVLDYSSFVNEGKGLRRNMLKVKKKEINSLRAQAFTAQKDATSQKDSTEDTRLANKLTQIIGEIDRIITVLKNKSQWDITRKEANSKINSLRNDLTRLTNSVAESVLKLTQWDSEIKPIMDEVLAAQAQMEEGFSEISKSIYYEDLQTVSREELFAKDYVPGTGSADTLIRAEDLEASKKDKTKQEAIGKMLTRAEMRRVEQWAIKEKKMEVVLETVDSLGEGWMEKYGLTDEEKDFILAEAETNLILKYREESGQLVMLNSSGYYKKPGMICFTWPDPQYESSDDPKYRLEGEWKWNGTAPEISWNEVEKFSLPALGEEGNLYTTKGDPYEYGIAEDGGKLTWWFKGRKGYKTNSKYPDWKSLLNNIKAQVILNERHPECPIPAEDRPNE